MVKKKMVKKEMRARLDLTTSCSPPQPRQGHTGLAVRSTRTSSQELIPRLLQASQAVDKAAVASLCNFPIIPTDRYSYPREQSPQQRHTFFDGQSSPSLPDPEISSPLTLPSPLSISRRTLSLQLTLPDRTRSSRPSTVSNDIRHHSSTLLPLHSGTKPEGANINVINRV
jgi:hypothetical protein